MESGLRHRCLSNETSDARGVPAAAAAAALLYRGCITFWRPIKPHSLISVDCGG